MLALVSLSLSLLSDDDPFQSERTQVSFTHAPGSTPIDETAYISVSSAAVSSKTSSIIHYIGIYTAHLICICGFLVELVGDTTTAQPRKRNPAISSRAIDPVDFFPRFLSFYFPSS